MEFQSKILITGSRGLLGTALVNELKKQGYQEIYTPTSLELDLLDKLSVERWFTFHKPEYVFHLASLVYGLKGNMDNQLKSIHQNTLMNLNLFDASVTNNIKKIFFAGTVASYPYPYPTLPLNEESFFNGEPHDGEYGYAVSKRHALSYLKILKDTKEIDYSYGIFTNMYGINDKFDMDGGHVIPSLIKKAIISIKTSEKILEVWGNKNTTRDFLNSHDAAEAAILCMKEYSGYINISSGEETTMEELVNTINEIFDNKLTISWNSNAPIGVPLRVVDNQKLLNLGFKKSRSLFQGIKETIEWYNNNADVIRK